MLAQSEHNLAAAGRFAIRRGLIVVYDIALHHFIRSDWLRNRYKRQRLGIKCRAWVYSCVLRREYYYGRTWFVDEMRQVGGVPTFWGE